jgi:Acetyltransferase (GNAT) domain
LTLREPATDLTGYRNSAYAASLAEFGKPRRLPQSGGWVLERPVAGGSYKDAMGCYPLFSCTDWSGLKADLDELATDLVCISLVTDPFGCYDKRDLQNCFSDKFVPFKTHYVADLRSRPRESVAAHHRYYAQRALRFVDIERCDQPSQFLDEWMSLYDNLIARHRMSGFKVFSRRAFSVQLAIPGVVLLRARLDGEIVGAHLWYVQGDVVHSHLAAANARGYDLSVSYALHWFALETFADEAAWINFGGGAGLNSDDTDGLTIFKKGWATETRPTYFCGRIFDHVKYADALTVRGLHDNDYFPAYRRDEFV